MTQVLADLTSPVVTGDLLVVPLGSTEQHGPHLPLSADTDVACALAATAPGAVVAPPLPYGSSGEHAGFAGTLSIGQVALELVLVELVRSASFPRVLLLNGHGGNAEPVRRAVAVLRGEGRDVRAWGPSWSGDAHAGRTETSVLLALGRPVLDERPVGATAPLASLLPLLRTGGVRAVSPNGVLGDARGASAEEGRRLLAEAAADLRAFLAAWLEAPPPAASPAPPAPSPERPAAPAPSPAPPPAPSPADHGVVPPYACSARLHELHDRRGGGAREP